MSERWFSHSGDLGDIIYSLPTIRKAGGGKLYLFHAEGKTAHGMTRGKAALLAPLLERQPYIHGVEFIDQPRDHSLNGFRDHWQKERTLADMHLATHGFDWRERSRAWLQNVEPHSVARVVIHRSARYRNPKFPWKSVVERYRGDLVMLGLREEWQEFCNTFGKVPWHRTRDFLEMASVIAGSTIFIGNQSSPEAVCEGLKHPKILELSPTAQGSCLFRRWGAVYVPGEKLELPDLDGI